VTGHLGSRVWFIVRLIDFDCGYRRIASDKDSILSAHVYQGM